MKRNFKFETLNGESLSNVKGGSEATKLAPVELDAIVGGNAIKIVGTNGNHCSCGNTTQTTQTTDSTSVKKL